MLQILDILNQPPTVPVYTPRKRKALTLEDRVAVIQMAEAGQSARGIASMYNVGKTQIQNILKDKFGILNKWMEGIVSKDAVYLNPRQLTYGDIDQLVWQWYQRNSSGEQRITGKQIQDTALQIAKELGYDKFTASTGWLNGWQKRHNVRLGLPQSSKSNSGDGAAPNSMNQGDANETFRLALAGALQARSNEDTGATGHSTEEGSN